MAEQKREAPSTSGLIAAARTAAKDGRRGPPPVHLWNPPYCGEIDIVIKRDGTWFHEGTPIGRPGLVNLFASILKAEAGRFYLVTPVEKVGIRVEDAPFVAVDFEQEGADITFVTNVGDRVTAGPAHPLRFEIGPDEEPAPYVEVRRGLEALIDRKSFYRLVELGEERNGQFGIASGQAFFPIMSAAALR